MGVNQDRVIMLVFILGGAMAGVAALLFTIRFDITKFDIGFIIGIKAFTAAVLGGIGNLRGALSVACCSGSSRSTPRRCSAPTGPT